MPKLKVTLAAVCVWGIAKTSLHRLPLYAQLIILTVASFAAALPPSPVRAEQPLYVVGNDHGGYLRDRLIELRNLQRSGKRVEIRGQVCFSTCTMFLGLPDTCISPNTIFGFHGPSRNGQQLARKDFDYFSRVIADYYPEALREWFMEEGRNRISGIHKVRGSEIIRMGVPACRTA